MKVYIYPTYTPSRDKSGNLYIKNFHEAFSEEPEVTLVNRAWKIGICSIFFNLDAEVFIIQWVDLIPRKRFGKIQFFFFLAGVQLLRTLRKKIVWVLHNKKSHAGDSALVDRGMCFMARKSSLVIAHAQEGVTFFDGQYPLDAGKCHYIPHPVYDDEIYESLPEKYDYVIWGSVDRRKKVLEFIKYAASSPYMSRQRILVCGLCRDSEYARAIEAAMADNVTFVNRFVSDEELREYIGESRIILFTYSSESLLSSGALIYSLNFNKMIIGPDAGNFRDMKGIVSCYDKMEDIETIPFTRNEDAIRDFIHSNLWEAFPGKLLSLLP